ncbi:Heterokaryon incompatibility [Metarhizium guizhouense ARSEF 977]|uniref:Heterokaryon incompatibility n=1 Tax=Metarhizium guizhouense (strain ARSEF 977) TaxID=1276136 RepID=A0A0B4GU17_METGA|nr:Heterokaryon incompatibility [Metarhizium guizhouense ARSEF 977]
MYGNLGERDVRLMVLCPGAASDPLVCYMKTVVLNKSLDFEALSYEWKESRGFANITCGQTKVPITQNLAAALRAFRVPGKRGFELDLLMKDMEIITADVRDDDEFRSFIELPPPLFARDPEEGQQHRQVSPPSYYSTCQGQAIPSR